MKNIQEKVTEAVKGRQRVSVSEFIDAYWPLSPETKKLQEISLEKDTSFDEWKNSVHAQEVMYFDEMRERFGNEKIGGFVPGMIRSTPRARYTTENVGDCPEEG